MKLPRFVKNLFAALAFGTPKFDHGRDSTSNSDLRNETIEGQRTRFIPGGTVEKVNKHYGVTIAGGPGSQRIGDTFDALAPRVREEMIAARKGVIRPERSGYDTSQDELPTRFRRHGTAAIAHALASWYERTTSGKLVPRRDAAERVDHDTRKALIGKDDLKTAVDKARGDNQPPRSPVRFS